MTDASARQPRTAGLSEGLIVRISPGAGAGGRDAARAGSTDDSRSMLKRKAIIEAATTLFLRNGYQGTSVEEIAALAAVSKQTVYKNFGDKERLFSDIILGITASAEEFAADVAVTLGATDDVDEELHQLARRYLKSVMRPQVLRLRRLVIGEAGRFPDLARAYYARAPERVLTALAAGLQRLSERGLLRLDDPHRAADHFAFLILGRPLDRAMFCGDHHGLTDAELEHSADQGVRVFLAAYTTA